MSELGNISDASTGAHTTEAEFARRIEEASLNAWPAMQQILLDGWVLRFARGFTKRSNSIVPLYTADYEHAATIDKVRYCENLYAKEQLQTVFRITSVDPHHLALDRLLAKRGYQQDDSSLVLTRQCQPSSRSERLVTLPIEHWLRHYCALTGMQEPAASLHRIILKAISGDCSFAVLMDQQQVVCCGLAVVERELVGLFDIFTHPQHRAKGFAAEMVDGLLHWASTRGADQAYLQMLSDNAPASRLYQKLGFREIYRYWYRCAA